MPRKQLKRKIEAHLYVPDECPSTCSANKSVKCCAALEALCSNITREIEPPTTDLGDPNLLVDRLRILVAATQAGNRGHTDEIIFIINDLRNAGYITGYGNDIYYNLIYPDNETEVERVWKRR